MKKQNVGVPDKSATHDLCYTNRNSHQGPRAPGLRSTVVWNPLYITTKHLQSMLLCFTHVHLLLLLLLAAIHFHSFLYNVKMIFCLVNLHCFHVYVPVPTETVKPTIIYVRCVKRAATVEKNIQSKSEPAQHPFENDQQKVKC